jgi:hypothetical protein
MFGPSNQIRRGWVLRHTSAFVCPSGGEDGNPGEERLPRGTHSVETISSDAYIVKEAGWSLVRLMGRFKKKGTGCSQGRICFKDVDNHFLHNFVRNCQTVPAIAGILIVIIHVSLVGGYRSWKGERFSTC